MRGFRFFITGEFGAVFIKIKENNSIPFEKSERKAGEKLFLRVNNFVFTLNFPLADGIQPGGKQFSPDGIDPVYK